MDNLDEQVLGYFEVVRSDTTRVYVRGDAIDFFCFTTLSTNTTRGFRTTGMSGLFADR